MGSEKDQVFFGAGLSTQDMDGEFKSLYNSLLAYKNNIFHFVDTICSDCEAGERLAMNIAERDSSLLQRLVAKECESRRMVRVPSTDSVLEKLSDESSSQITVKQVLKARESSLEDNPKND